MSDRHEFDFNTAEFISPPRTRRRPWLLAAAWLLVSFAVCVALAIISH